MRKPAKQLAVILLAVTTIIFGFGEINSEAKKVTTKLTAPAKKKTEKAEKLNRKTAGEIDFKEIAPKLTFMAYDKKAGSAKETFFVDNGSDKTLDGIEIEISYFTSGGKLIHKRKEYLKETFPANETRKVDITSWDTQKSFHYINSVPSTKGSTPYTVKFKIISIRLQ